MRNKEVLIKAEGSKYFNMIGRIVEDADGGWVVALNPFIKEFFKENELIILED